MASPEELQILLKAVGAKDTEAALKNISGLLRKAGEEAKGVGPATKAANAALDELKTRGGELAGSLGPAGSVLAALGPAGLAAAAGIGAVVSVAGLAASTLLEWTHGAIETTGAIGDLQDATTLSASTLQEFSYVASQTGTTQGALADATLRASRAIGSGGQQTSDALRAIGLSLIQIRQLSPDEQFGAIIAGLKGVTDSSRQAALAQQIFGRDAGILRVIRSDYAGLADDAHRLGTVIGDEQVAAGDKLGDTLAKLEQAWIGFRNQVGLFLATNPEVQRAANDLAELVGQLTATVRANADEIKLAGDALAIGFTGTTFTNALAQLERFVTLLEATGQIEPAALPAPRTQPSIFAAPAGIDETAALQAGIDAQKQVDEELKASEEAARKLRDTMAQLSGAAARQQLTDLAAAVGGIGGFANVATGEYQKLKDQVRALSQSAPVPDILKPLLVTGEQFGPTLEELGIEFDVLATRDLSGLSGQLKQAQAATGGATKSIREQVEAARDAERAAQGQAAAIEFVAKQMLETGELTQAEFDKITGKTNEAKDAAIDWSSVLGDVRNAFEVLGIGADSFFGKVLGGFSAALAAAQRFKEAQKTGGFQGAVGQGLSGLQAGAAAFQSGSFFGGATSGAAFGASVGGPLGGVIGGAVGGILGIFGGKARVRKELADLRKQLLDSVGGSMEELRKRASALGVDISRAFTTKNPAELKKIIDELNKAAEEQKKRWEGVQTAVAGLTQRVHGFSAELGRSIRLSENVAAADVFQTIRDKIDGGKLSLDILNQATERQRAEFERLGFFAVATFSSYVRESGDAIGALREIESSLSDLSLAQDLFGLKGSESFEQLLQLRGVVQANSEVADSIQGLNQLMQGLGDAGVNNSEIFNAFGEDAVELFAKLTENGAGSNQALALLAPTLQRLWEHQQRFGDITDEATLALLAEAETQGVVGESMKAVNEQILDVLLAIGDALGAKIPEGLRRMGDAAQREFGRFGNAADNASGSIPNVGDFGGGAGFGPPTGPSGGQIGDGFAIGGTVHAPLSGRQITVHGTEHIFRPEQLTAVVGAAVERGYQAAVAHFAGAAQAGGGGDTIVVLDGERVGRTMRRRAETGRDTPRRGPMAPRRR